MLSLPFMKIPVILAGMPDLGEAEDQKGTPDKEVSAYIYPEAIEAYYPGYFSGSVIQMKSGCQYLTRLKVEQIEAGLGTYWQHCQGVIDKKVEGSKIISM